MKMKEVDSLRRSQSLIGATFVFGGLILAKVYLGGLSDFNLRIILILGIPWIIASCVFVVIRREAPRFGGLPNIKGPWAVFQGLLGLLLLGGCEVFLLYGLIKAVIAK
jgi:hypothetical protein